VRRRVAAKLGGAPALHLALVMAGPIAPRMDASIAVPRAAV